MTDTMFATPLPRDIDQLRNLLARIKAGEAGIHLGNRALKVFTALLDTPRHAAVYSISQLASSLGVNASTLTRLAKKLGYSGFNEFQNVFRDHIAATGHFYTEQAGRLLHPGNDGKSSTIDLLARVANDETANITQMLNNVKVSDLETAATLLATAPRVRAHGLRQSYAIACFISYALGMVRSDVSILASHQHGVAHALAQLDKGDVLVSIGCAPYTRATVVASRIAAEKGMPIIAITDSYSSPLGLSADYTFVAPTGSVFFSNSIAASLVMAEVLLTLTAKKLGDRAISALKYREQLIKEQNIEL